MNSVTQMNDALTQQAEVTSGSRFEFGENWRRFLSVLDEQRIEQATASLAKLLRMESLSGQSFLDVGSGSGLSSLSAMRLGASRIHSFDYDPASVACTRELKRRYFPDASFWTIEQASALNSEQLRSIGQFDVVYSWGVLHHTGDMWCALQNMMPLVTEGGRLAIAIYNDQGGVSRRWSTVKRIYNRLPAPLRMPFVLQVMGPLELKKALSSIVRLKPMEYVRTWTAYETRGMSRWHDIVDWVGGYPFEVARPDQIFELYRRHGFRLEGLKTCAGSHGCNEYLFLNGP